MNAVIKKSVVEESAGIPRPKRGGAINQDDVKSSRQVSINVLKRRQAAHRKSVEIAGENELRVRLAGMAELLQQASQSKVGLGDTRLLCDQRSIAASYCASGSVLSQFLASERAAANASRSTRGVSGGITDRFGSKPASFPGGITRTVMIADRWQNATMASNRRRKSRNRSSYC